ncbi:MAG: AsmA family protein [Endozoicomonadaceae bacterium]|nr:AsmA family protein [Endozoicomonadaceae bacterium]MBE8232635.1 AsmA family protein [Endozoicomonadaceae bacterium]
MIKWIKLFFSVTILIMLVLVILPYVIPLHHYKSQITQLIQNKTGYRVSLNGEIIWHILPKLHIIANDIIIEQEEKQKLATLDQITFSLSWLPLLKNTLHFTKIELNQVTLDIIKNKAGQFNVMQTAFDTIKNPEITTNSQPTIHWKTEQLICNTVNIHYENQQENRVVLIKNASINLHLLPHHKKPISTNLSLQIINPDIKLDMQLKSIGKLDFDKNHYILDQIQLTCKTSNQQTPFDLTGRLSFINNQLLFDLTGSTLNLKDYWTPVENTTIESSKLLHLLQRNKTQPLIPIHFIKHLNTEGFLKLNALTIDATTLTNSSINLKAFEGMITISNLETHLYDGFLKATAQINTKSATPQYLAQASITDMNIQNITENIQTLPQCTGKANIDFNLQSQGMTQTALTSNLNGVFKIQINDGLFLNFSMDHIVSQAIESLKGQILSSSKSKILPASKNDHSHFKQLKSSWIIENGIAKNRDFVANMHQFTLTGNGLVNLKNKKIDYFLTAKMISNNNQEQTSLIAEEYSDIILPIRCKSTWFGFKRSLCGLDFNRLKRVAVPLIKQVIHKKLEDKLDLEVKSKLEKSEEPKESQVDI